MQPDQQQPECVGMRDRLTDWRQKETKTTPLWVVGIGLGSSAECGTWPLQHHYPGLVPDPCSETAYCLVCLSHSVTATGRLAVTANAVAIAAIGADCKLWRAFLHAAIATCQLLQPSAFTSFSPEVALTYLTMPPLVLLMLYSIPHLSQLQHCRLHCIGFHPACCHNIGIHASPQCHYLAPLSPRPCKSWSAACKYASITPYPPLHNMLLSLWAAGLQRADTAARTASAA